MATKELKNIFNRLLYIQTQLEIPHITNELFIICALSEKTSSVRDLCKKIGEKKGKWCNDLLKTLSEKMSTKYANFNEVLNESLGKIENFLKFDEKGDLFLDDFRFSNEMIVTLHSAYGAKMALIDNVKRQMSNTVELEMSLLMVFYGFVDVTNSLQSTHKLIEESLHLNDKIIGEALIKEVFPNTKIPNSIIDAISDSISEQNQHEPKKMSDEELLQQLMEKMPETDTKVVKVCNVVDLFDFKPLVRRDELVEQIVTAMSRKNQKFILLVGESGCGLTYFQFLLNEYLNQRYDNKFQHLHYYKEYVLNNEYIKREIFRNNESILDFFASITEFLMKNNGFLFIDDLGEFFVVEKSELTEMALLTMLNTQESPTVVATMRTADYTNYITENPRLNAIATKIDIPSMTEKECREVFKLIKKRFEKDFICKVSEEALTSAYRLSERYIKTTALPKSFLQILDWSGAEMLGKIEVPQEITEIEKKYFESQMLYINDHKNEEGEEAYFMCEKIRKQDKEKLSLKVRNFKKELRHKNIELGKEVIANAVSKMTGIPSEQMTDDEVYKIAKLKENLMKEVIGQDNAINILCRTLKRRAIGLCASKGKTIGNLIFCGESGVGKTILAKKLAKYLFGSERNMIRIDMSEYSEKHTASKLIGTSAGYVGYEENGGVLTKDVKEKKYCVVLLDEIEKASPEIFNIFLQVFDDGRLTSGSGELIDFSNTIIIMTSNVGARKAQEFGGGVGFNTNADEHKHDIFEKELRKTFSPEFLNRIDNIVLFNHLCDEDMLKITQLQLDKLVETMRDNGRTLTMDDNVAHFVCQKAMEEKNMGARPINRAIQDLIENPLADLIVDNYAHHYDSISIKTNGDKLEFYKEKSAEVKKNQKKAFDE